MKTLTLLLCSSLIAAALEAQNVLMPGAFTRKLGLDASTTKSINLKSIEDEITYQLATWRLSGKMGDLTPDSTIFEMMNQVNTLRLNQTVQHLQDYGTRYAYLPQADSAGDWIYKKLDSINNLSVVTQYFPFPNTDTGFNVLATLTGTKYPDEYVIIGAHYDSWSGDSTKAPGANDDGVGIAGVLEAARIMSQYTFDRSIIFACWTMEEINHGGSEYFACRAADSNMKILAYFNIDCGGYLKPGLQPVTSVMHHLQSDYLAAFYTETCGIYLPSLIITQDSWSLSDDLSFSLNGYQGIWNFENSNNFAPYNHTYADKIGPNVNSFYNLSLLVKADIANLARIANMEPRPLNLRGLPEDGKIALTWNPNDSVDHYNVYRDSILYVTTDDTGFVDFDVTNGVNYSYYVTSVFTNSGNESEGSSPVSAKPYPPMTFPFVDNFESGIMYWDLEPPWGLENKGISQSACLSDSPGTNYKNLSNPMAFLKPLNLVGYIDSEVSFMTNYNLENNYDVCFLFVFDNSLVFLDMLTGNQPNWIQRTCSLNDFLGKPDVQLYFLLYADNSYYFDGIYIDNFTISCNTGIPQPGKDNASNTSKVIPNPFCYYTSIEYVLDHDATVYLIIYDYLGKEVEVVVNEQQSKGKHQVQWNAEGLSAGIYYYRLSTNDYRLTTSGKLVIAR